MKKTDGYGISKVEAASVRSQLRLRWNTSVGCFEVYTTIHGSGIFRWFKIAEHLKDWYIDTFNLTVEKYCEIDPTSGAINNYQPTAN